MKKQHPHRYFFIDILKKTRCVSMSECDMSKFSLKPPQSGVVVTGLFSFLCVLILLLFNMLGFAICGYENFDHVSWDITLMVYYVAQFMLFLCLPIPLDGITMVIDEVQKAEQKDDLQVTPRFWIYFHYFILRNHPLLSMMTFIGRQAVVAGMFYVSFLFIHTPLAFLVFLCVFSVIFVNALFTLLGSTKKGYWD